MPENDQYIASLPKPPLSAGNELHADYLLEIAALRRSDQREKMKLWRAGAYGDLYGPYSTKGTMKTPPPRVYVEE